MRRSKAGIALEKESKIISAFKICTKYGVFRIA